MGETRSGCVSISGTGFGREFNIGWRSICQKQAERFWWSRLLKPFQLTAWAHLCSQLPLVKIWRGWSTIFGVAQIVELGVELIGWFGMSSRLGKSMEVWDSDTFMASIWQWEGSKRGTLQRMQVLEHQWREPTEGTYKCNVDTTLFNTDNMYGIGMCIRKHTWSFYKGKTMWFSGVPTPPASTDNGTLTSFTLVGWDGVDIGVHITVLLTSCEWSEGRLTTQYIV